MITETNENDEVLRAIEELEKENERLKAVPVKQNSSEKKKLGSFTMLMDKETRQKLRVDAAIAGVSSADYVRQLILNAKP